MSERFDDRELDRALSDIGERLAYPSRDMWPAVRERIAHAPRRSWWAELGLGRSLAPAIATLSVILVAAFVLTPDLTARAAEALGLPGVRIFQVPATPSPMATTGAYQTFGGQRAASLDDATRLAGFPVRAPSALGAPDEVYVEDAPSRVTLVYRSRGNMPVTAVPGISALIVQFRGRVDQGVLGKTAGPETKLETVPLSGAVAYWLSGQPHQVFFFDANGNFREESLRLAGNTLLWEAGGVTYRLEAGVSKEEAVRIASTLR